jgi:hypothetical protein
VFAPYKRAMSQNADGNAISHWWILIEEAVKAEDGSAVDAIVERMDGWPTIIDVDEYVDSADVQARFSTEMGRVEQRRDEARTAGNDDLPVALGGLVSMLTAT